MLSPRDYYSNGDYYRDPYDSPWYSWGRWILSAVIVVAFIFFMFLLFCLTARRRRRAGMTPYYGTGWMSGKPPAGHAAPMYAGPQYGQPAVGTEYQHSPTPAPPYNPQPPNSYAGANTGYYAPQTGVELQQPLSTYQPHQGGQPVYSPPPGPPPSHMN